MNTSSEKDSLALPVIEQSKGVMQVNKIFRCIYGLIIGGAILLICYWLFASDRYVSDATIIIQNTDQTSLGGFDLSALMSGGGGFSMPDQLLLQEHLLSVDMLKKLDAALDLRSHFSDSSKDIASRMWFKDASMEWFYRHYLARVDVHFDTAAGVLRISTQAYSPKMAHDITSMLVAEGERYMNEISHELARTQVNFLDGQVESAQNQMREATNDLLAFQNKKGLVSPKATVENIHAIIGKLEGQRTELQTQQASLPRSLERNHPTRKSLATSLAAIEKQIAQEQAKLASTRGKPLNTLVEEEQRLELELKFKQDLYKSALIGLEKGRMDAARTLKLVSVIQSPTMPEYAWEPRRIYGTISTFCVAILLLGIARLLKSVVLDHVD